MTTTHLTMGIVCLLAFGRCPWWPPCDDDDDNDNDAAGGVEVDGPCTWDVDNLSFPIHVWTGVAAWGEIAFDGNCDLIVGGGEELPYVDALYRVDKDDGLVSVVVEIEQLHPGSVYITAITHRASDDRIYFVGALLHDDIFTHTLYAVDDQNVLHEIFEMESPIGSLTVAPAGFGDFGDQLIAGVNSPSQVVAIDVETQVVTPIAPSGLLVRAVTFGPDGTLYVAEGDLNRISTVTADGVITTFHTDVQNPRGLAVSPDGARMFVAHQPDGVARIDPISLSDLTLTPGVPVALGGEPVGIVVDGANHVLYEMPFDDYSYAGIGMFTAP